MSKQSELVVYRDDDADLSHLEGKNIVILIGYFLIQWVHLNVLCKLRIIWIVVVLSKQ